MNNITNITKKELSNELCKFLNNMHFNISSPFELYKTLRGFLNNHRNIVINGENTFGTILDSLQKNFSTEICKMCNSAEENNIFNFVNKCHKHKDFFCDCVYEEFYNKSNRTYEKIVTQKINIDEEFKRIKKELHSFDNVIFNLENHRNKYWVHADNDYFLNEEKIFEEYSVKYNEIEALIECLKKTLSFLYLYLEQSSYLFKVDFQKELEAIFNND